MLLGASLWSPPPPVMPLPPTGGFFCEEAGLLGVVICGRRGRGLQREIFCAFEEDELHGVRPNTIQTAGTTPSRAKNNYCRPKSSIKLLLRTASAGRGGRPELPMEACSRQLAGVGHVLFADAFKVALLHGRPRHMRSRKLRWGYFLLCCGRLAPVRDAAPSASRFCKYTLFRTVVCEPRRKRLSNLKGVLTVHVPMYGC